MQGNDQSADASSITTLDFSGPHFTGYWIKEATNHELPGTSIVVNVSTCDAYIANRVVTADSTPVAKEFALRPWKSTRVTDTSLVAAESALVLRVRNPINAGSVLLDPSWHPFGNDVPAGSPFPRDTPLWISKQHDLGTVAVDPWQFAGQSACHTERLELKVNLWYAPPRTDCFIHTQHPFLEVHTQVHGYGHMQKFKSPDAASLYEDVIMSPGMTHDPFFLVDDDGSLLYPWHRYFADTDCVWLAIELHRAAGASDGQLAITTPPVASPTEPPLNPIARPASRRKKLS